MATIKLTTEINAPIEICFDMARNVDIHQLSAIKTNEKAVSGRTSGLCELNDEITWEAKHFGIKQKLTVRITKMDRPYFFEDIMLKGAFRKMIHRHHFEQKNGVTYMNDVFSYQVPFGIIGDLFDKIILTKYMTRFLKSRNEVLKSVSEKAA